LWQITKPFCHSERSEESFVLINCSVLYSLLYKERIFLRQLQMHQNLALMAVALGCNKASFLEGIPQGQRSFTPQNYSLCKAFVLDYYCFCHSERSEESFLKNLSFFIPV
jgi:hypothetical protein